jgi:single-stranded-DNA-specific exonuclease
LTDDDREATLLAEELEELNRDRQMVEQRILREAVDQVESWPEARRRRRGYVVAGEGWHEGVIGIVASRLVERYNRPVVMIAGTDGEWKGSGRSVPAFDLHGGLGACAGHLERFGGHRAAAGLTIAAERVETFAVAFAAHADEVLTEDDLQPTTRIDAIVPGAKLNLDLCSELGRLAPFGIGNPGVTLLVDGCEIADPSTVGDGKHLRFRVRQHGRDSGQAIAFNLGAQLDRFRRDARYDVAFRLQENRWNGVASPQLVVRRVFDAVDGFAELREWLAGQWQAGEGAWTSEARAIFAELELADGSRRSLWESQAFRQLLEARPAYAAAA